MVALAQRNDQVQTNTTQKLDDVATKLSRLTDRLADPSRRASVQSRTSSAHRARSPSSSLPVKERHLPVLRVGPWKQLSATNANHGELIEELINSLPRAHAFALPIQVVPEKNRAFALAFFQDAEDRDDILDAWRDAGGLHAEIVAAADSAPQRC